MPVAHIIPSTWYFMFKRFPDGRLCIFKSRFCARGDRQVWGLYYFENYTPVVSWITVILMLSLSINQCWATRKADFSNDFVQANLVEDFYTPPPPSHLILTLKLAETELRWL